MRTPATALALVVAMLATPRAECVPLGVDLVAPHAVRAPAARLDAALRAEVLTTLATTPVADVPTAVAFALALTGRHLHFGLSHRTSLAFSTVEREGNCVEYAHLFGAVFNLVAERAGLDARAYAVRSDTRLFGAALSSPALRDHDWSLVVDRRTGTRAYIDASFDDAGLGWDVHARVAGNVRLP